jgi:hypothetical protein
MRLPWYSTAGHQDVCRMMVPEFHPRFNAGSSIRPERVEYFRSMLRGDQVNPLSGLNLSELCNYGLAFGHHLVDLPNTRQVLQNLYDLSSTPERAGVALVAVPLAAKILRHGHVSPESSILSSELLIRAGIYLARNQEHHPFTTNHTLKAEAFGDLVWLRWNHGSSRDRGPVGLSAALLTIHQDRSPALIEDVVRCYGSIDSRAPGNEPAPTQTIANELHSAFWSYASLYFRERIVAMLGDARPPSYGRQNPFASSIGASAAAQYFHPPAPEIFSTILAAFAAPKTIYQAEFLLHWLTREGTREHLHPLSTSLRTDRRVREPIGLLAPRLELLGGRTDDPSVRKLVFHRLTEYVAERSDLPRVERALVGISQLMRRNSAITTPLDQKLRGVRDLMHPAPTDRSTDGFDAAEVGGGLIALKAFLLFGDSGFPNLDSVPHVERHLRNGDPADVGDFDPGDIADDPGGFADRFVERHQRGENDPSNALLSIYAFAAADLLLRICGDEKSNGGSLRAAGQVTETLGEMLLRSQAAGGVHITVAFSLGLQDCDATDLLSEIVNRGAPYSNWAQRCTFRDLQWLALTTLVVAGKIGVDDATRQAHTWLSEDEHRGCGPDWVVPIVFFRALALTCPSTSDRFGEAIVFDVVRNWVDSKVISPGVGLAFSGITQALDGAPILSLLTSGKEHLLELAAYALAVGPVSLIESYDNVVQELLGSLAGNTAPEICWLTAARLAHKAEDLRRLLELLGSQRDPDTVSATCSFFRGLSDRASKIDERAIELAKSGFHS